MFLVGSFSMEVLPEASSNICCWLELVQDIDLSLAIIDRLHRFDQIA